MDVFAGMDQVWLGTAEKIQHMLQNPRIKTELGKLPYRGCHPFKALLRYHRRPSHFNFSISEEQVPQDPWVQTRGHFYTQGSELSRQDVLF